MKKYCYCIFRLVFPTCFLFSAVTASAQNVVQAIPRTDENSLIAHAELLKKKHQGQIDIFFEGDSITRRWGTGDAAWSSLLQNWNDNFYGWNAADFAWGGDTVQNILWSLEEGELEGVNPKVIVLLAGTNNLVEGLNEEQEAAKVEEVVSGIQQILDFMQSEAPDATIILTGILPRNGADGSTTLIPVINKINARLATLADGNDIHYININAGIADAEGKLFEGMTVDGLHLDVKGFQVWADALKPIFAGLLGPPAAVDHSPPPSTNPAAR